jgi:hypothetical protein
VQKQTGKQVLSVKFNVHAGSDDRFHYIAVSDPQVRNERDFKRWCQETVPDMVEVIDSLKQLQKMSLTFM